MDDRKGEKFGWIGGWSGGFIWVALLSAIFLFQSKWAQGFIGLGLTGAAVYLIIKCAPWRHPDTPYWKLMLPVYLLLFGSVVWACWSYGGQDIGLDWWSGFWLLPVLLPFATAGRRRWKDKKAQDL
jgi:hypothetical protein